MKQIMQFTGPLRALALGLSLAAAPVLAQDATHGHMNHGQPAQEHAGGSHGGQEHAGHGQSGHQQAAGMQGMDAKGGHDHSAHEHATAAPKKDVVSAADIDLRDRTLVDQDGRKVDFVSDVIGDRIVVMDFVFTTCTNVCPILSAVLAQVQDSLGDRVGHEVAIVSLTVDPVRDTPQRLKAYSAKHRAGKGWTWLTGNKSTVEDVLIGLGAYSVNFEDHPPMIVVGDRKTGQWSRFFGFPSPKRIVEQVEALEAARKAAAGS